MIAPTSIYVWQTDKSVNGDGTTNEVYSNGTQRLVRAPDSADITDLEVALGFEFIDTYPNGTQQVFFRNGSVAMYTPSGFQKWVVAPKSILLYWTVETMDDGSTFTHYSNGTTVFNNRKLNELDDIYYNMTSIDFFFESSTVVKNVLQVTQTNYYRNGTIAKFTNGLFVSYVKAPESFYYLFSDGSYEFQYYGKNQVLHYNSPLSEDAEPQERSCRYDNYTIFSNGTKRVCYRNGTIALFKYDFTSKKETFSSYERAPVDFYLPVEETKLDNGVLMNIFENQTVRYIYPEPTIDSTRMFNATFLRYEDHYSNGTVRKVFKNGTIAIFFNGVFLNYEVAPSVLYIDCPRNDYPDGSYELFYLNGTRRWFPPPQTINNTAKENSTALIYSDCFPNSDCYFYYKNGTVGVWNNGVFTKLMSGIVVPSTPPPPAPTPTPAVTPSTPASSQFVNKTGPKRQVYDKSQGGIKKYKEQS